MVLIWEHQEMGGLPRQDGDPHHLTPEGYRRLAERLPPRVVELLRSNRLGMSSNRPDCFQRSLRVKVFDTDFRVYPVNRHRRSVAPAAKRARSRHSESSFQSGKSAICAAALSGPQVRLSLIQRRNGSNETRTIIYEQSYPSDAVRHGYAISPASGRARSYHCP